MNDFAAGCVLQLCKMQQSRQQKWLMTLSASTPTLFFPRVGISFFLCCERKSSVSNDVIMPLSAAFMFN